MASLYKSKIQISKLLLTLVLLLVAIIWIVPLFFVGMNLFKGRQEYNLGSFWLKPVGNQFMMNWDAIKNGYPIFKGMINSFTYSFFGALFSLTLGTLAAYSITHLSIKHKMFWFMLIYSGTIFPFQIYLIPLFKAYMKIGLYDTSLGMILFYTVISIPFCMFVMRNNFLGINKEICESAKIEGATDSQVLVKLLLPMSVVSLSVLFLTQFSWGWNDLIFGLTLTKSDDIKTVMPMLSIMDKNNSPVLFMACVVASIPAIALFSVLQKNFEKGLVYTSK